ncbi:hypothetical protein Btru_030977 [Bulinus truncatus]|nr:hypothetical protein Btru_030977 [Bulinus truncatus]
MSRFSYVRELLSTAMVNASLADLSKVSWMRCYNDDNLPVEILICQILTCFVNPALACVGVMANTLCVAILRKSGLKKPSNILLLSLVLADTTFLFNAFNFPTILIYYDTSRPFPELCAWQYTHKMNMFLLAVDIFVTQFACLGAYAGSFIAIAITLERLLAVFFPLSFKKIVNIHSAVISSLISVIIWLPWLLYNLAIVNFEHYDIAGELYILFKLNPKAIDINVYNILNEFVFEGFSSWLPSSLISVGCILIGIKVKITLRKRKQISAGKGKLAWSPRTTRTLLATSILFAVSRIFYSLAGYILYMVKMSKSKRSIARALMQTSYLINCSRQNTLSQNSLGHHRAEQVISEQLRTSQGRTGYHRTAYDITGQNMLSQNSLEHHRAEQVITEQLRTSQGRTGYNRTA